MGANAAERRMVQADVRAAAAKLLRECAVEEAPTPTDRLLEFCQLQTETFFFSDMLPPQIPGKRDSPKLAERRARLAQLDLDLKVRGILDSRDKVVYTHNTLTPEPRRFCTFHEIGHFLLGWQQAILYTCTELDLKPEVLDSFELEANWFAQACTFQGDRFALQAADYKPGIRPIKQLAKAYNASFEATARQYVESHHAPVALLALEPRADLGASHNAGEPLMAVKYSVVSQAMRRLNLGYIAPQTLLPFNHPATSVFMAGVNAVQHCMINLEFAPNSKSLPCEGEIFFNNRRVFVLAWPGRGGRGY